VKASLGQILSSFGAKEKALDYLTESLQINLASPNKNMFYITKRHKQIAVILLDQGKYKLAQDSINESFTYLKMMENKHDAKQNILEASCIEIQGNIEQ